MDDFDKTSTPKFDLEKIRQKSKLNLQPAVLLNFIQSYQNPDMRNKAANVIAATLMRNLGINDSNDLQSLINQERSGVNPNAEAALKQILSMGGITFDQDILQGKSMSIDTLRMFEELGMGPDAENEVADFFKQNGIDHLSPEKTPPKPKP
jgi:hypothetical protein